MSQQSVDNDHAYVSELLPWRINGRLTAEENSRVDAHLLICPDCRSQLAFFSAVDLQARAETSGWRPSPRHFSALMAQIDGAEAKSSAPAGMPAAPELGAVKSRLAGFFGSLAGLRWVAGAEALAIALLAAVLLHSKAPPSSVQVFETLSDASKPASNASEAEIRLLLEDQVTVKDLSALLREIHAQIRQGPSELGFFTVVVDKSFAGQALARLRDREGVKLAQPIESR